MVTALRHPLDRGARHAPEMAAFPMPFATASLLTEG
jgi:hypothetical protein